MNTNRDIPNKKTGLVRIFYALKHSLEGMNLAFKTEPAFRQEIILACISLPLAFVMPVSLVFKAFLMVSTIALLITELLNTAIESIANTVTQEFHPLVKRAKDMGSAAVLLSIVNLSVAWVFALLQVF